MPIMNQLRRYRTALAAVVLTASLLSASLLLAKPESGTKVKGKQKKSAASSVSGLRVLHVSGTPRQRGMAHGRQFAREILVLLDAFVKAERLSGGPEGYERNLGRIGATMAIEPKYQEELEGLFEGVRAATGGRMKIKSLGRDLTLEDVTAMNALADLSAFGCSSFAAWGPLTKTGDTIVARNLDWYYLPQMAKNQILLVQAPDRKTGRAGWATVTWPGQIGCFTGMNEEGVTVSMHDVYCGGPEAQGGFTPRSLILREAIEKAHASSAAEDILAVLKQRTVAVGNNIPVGVPYVESSKSPPFMVFEYDGKKSNGAGVAVRRAEGLRKAGSALNGGAAESPDSFDLCTNHYRKRGTAEPCWRYDKMRDALAECEEHNKPVDPNEAGEILAKAAVTPTKPVDGIITYHSVVFEPNRRTMRIAFCRGGKPATGFEYKSVSLDALLAEKD